MANVPRNVTGNSEQPVRDIRGWKIPRIPLVSTTVPNSTSPQIRTRNPHQNYLEQSNSNFKQSASIPAQVENQFSGERSYLFYQFWKPEVPRSLGQVWTVHQSERNSELVFFQNNYNGQIRWNCPLTEDELIEYFKKQDDRRWKKIVAEQQGNEKSYEASDVDRVNLDKSVISTYIETPGVSRHIGSTLMGIQQQKEIVTNYDEEPMGSNPDLRNMSFDNADILDRGIERKNLKRSYLECMNVDDVDEYYSNNSERFNINNHVPHTSTQPGFNYVHGQNERWNSNNNGHEKNVTGDIENDERYPGRDRCNFYPERRVSNIYNSIIWKSNYVYADEKTLSTNLNEFNVATDRQNIFEKDIEKGTYLTNVFTEEERSPEETKSKTSEKSSDAKSLDNSLEMIPENDVDEHYEEEKGLRDDGALEEERRVSNIYNSIIWKSNYVYADDKSLSTNLNEFKVTTDRQNIFEKDIEKETSLRNVFTVEERTPEETKSKTSEKSSDAKSLDTSLEMMPENGVDEHYEEENGFRDDGALEEGNRKNNEKDAFGKPVLKGILKSNSALRREERLIHSYVDEEEEGWINMKIVTDTRYFTTRTVTLNNDIEDLKKNDKNVFENPESSNSSSDDEEINLTRNQDKLFRTELLPELIERFCSILTKVIEVGMEKAFKENWKNQCKLKQPWGIYDCLMILENNWNIIGKNEETNSKIKEIRPLFEHFGRADELIIPEIMLALHLCKHLLGLLSAEYENFIHPFMRYFGAYIRKVKETLARREIFTVKKLRKAK